MPSNQARPSAWTPHRTAALKKSLLADSCNSQDDPSTNSGNSSTNNYELAPQTFTTPSSLTVSIFVLNVVQKANYLKATIAPLHILLSNVKSQAARQSECTYTPKWSNLWPAKPRADYKIYKEYDKAYWVLRKVLTSHCFKHWDLQLRTPDFWDRIQLCVHFAEAASKTAKGRLEFQFKYPAAFQKFKQVGTHIYEASRALTSAEDAVDELELRIGQMFAVNGM